MKQLLGFLSLASGLVLSLSGCRSGDGEVRIESVRLEDTGTELRAHVNVHNGTAYSLYVYQSPRRIFWDELTKTLTLSMREAECNFTSSTICTHYVFPEYVEVDGDEDKDVVVELPRTLTSLGGTTPGGGLALKKMEIATADRVVVQMAWADEKIEGTDRGQDPRAVVIAAEREILNGEWRR